MHLLALDTRILPRPLFHSQNQLDTKRRIVLSYGNRVIFCHFFIISYGIDVRLNNWDASTTGYESVRISVSQFSSCDRLFMISEWRLILVSKTANG